MKAYAKILSSGKTKLIIIIAPPSYLQDKLLVKVPYEK